MHQAVPVISWFKVVVLASLVVGLVVVAGIIFMILTRGGKGGG